MNTSNYIAGEWIKSSTTIQNINPSDTNDIIGEYSQCNSKQVETAFAAATEAQTIWQKTPLEKRYNVLMNIGNQLMAESAEIGALLSREEGKPLAEGKGETYRAGQFFTFYAAEILRQTGETADSIRPNIEIDMRREPMGNIAVISPWNFPIAIPAWKIAPALAYGNSVLWKPSNLTPATSVRLMEVIAAQDIPAGLVNLLMGSGRAIGQQLASHKSIHGITFTGSVNTGKSIAKMAAENMTKLQMEMGSKNPLLVMDDGNLDIAVACAINGAFSGTGQKCTASSRIIVHSKVHDSFVDKFIEASKKLVVGHALQDGVTIGPVVDRSQFESNLNYVEIAKKEGAEIVCGGNIVEQKTPGFYMQPAICINTKNDMTVNREEMFSPMACVIKVDSYEHALATSNDSEFGLSSSIITSSLARANHFKRNSNSGVVGINLPTGGMDYHVAFGGRGSSSYGSREQGSYAKEFYSEMKTSYTFADFENNLD